VPDHIWKPSYIWAKDASEMGIDNQDDEDMIHQAEIKILTETEQQKMRNSCKLAKEVLAFAGSLVKPGVTTDFIDSQVHSMILSHGAYPSPLGYYSFPKSVCISVNEVLCHGIPDSTVLEDGDVVSIDVTVFLDGFHGDNCKTWIVGEKTAAKEKLLHVNEKAVLAAVQQCGPGKDFSVIGRTITEVLSTEGYLSVPSFVGHGIGQEFHAFPWILHFENYEPGVMTPGMAFTIEPCIKEGTSDEHFIWDDQWTTVATDGGWSSQFEHTILITTKGAQILTL